MTVDLISHTQYPVIVCGTAAAICTGSENPNSALMGAMSCGHESVAEHASFTFRIEGVSRVLLAQLTRHRLASYSVQSQRYCGVKLEFVVPDTIKKMGWEQAYTMQMQECYATYNLMIHEGVPEEDARYIIPQGITCNLILTMNARELLHFFSLRCCNRAQWEIRELADRMRDLCMENAPLLFRRSGAPCQRGEKCPEGKKSCGHPRTIGGADNEQNNAVPKSD